MRLLIAALFVLGAAACSTTPTATPEPLTIPSPPTRAIPWEAFWAPLTWTTGVWADSKSVSGRAEEASLQVICNETLRSTEVRVLFDLDVGPRPDLSRYSASYATAEARKLVERRGLAAKAADETIHQIHIARRSTGEAGGWMKSGWRHYPSTNGYLVLRHAPAEAFISELAAVEEFAMLITHDHGADTAAVFDVRRLSTALGARDVGWGC